LKKKIFAFFLVDIKWNTVKDSLSSKKSLYKGRKFSFWMISRAKYYYLVFFDDTENFDCPIFILDFREEIEKGDKKSLKFLKLSSIICDNNH